MPTSFLRGLLHFRRTRPKAAAYLPGRFRPKVECLEERWVLATVHWINPAGGIWDDATSWSTGAVPGPDDDVVLDTPSDVTITHAAGDDMVHSIAGTDTLAVSGGSLALAASSAFDGVLGLGGGSLDVGFAARLTVNSPFVWTAGTIMGFGIVTVNGGLDITGPDPKLLDGVGLENAQTGILSGSPLSLHNGGFNNLPGATLTVEDSAIAADTDDYSNIINQGEMQFSGGGYLGAHTVGNGGTIRVEGGGFGMGGYRAAVGNSGTIELNGGDFSASGDYIDDSGAVTGAGNVRIVGIESAGIGGAMTASGDVNVSTTHAHVGGPGGISIGGKLTVNALDMSIGDTIHAGAIDLTGGDFEAIIRNASVFVDSDFRVSQRLFYFEHSTIETTSFTNMAQTEFLSATLTADSVLNPGYLTFDDASTFTIREITNQGYLSIAGSISGNLINSGQLAIAGPSGIGQLTVGGDFIQTARGELDLDISLDGRRSNQLNVGGTAYLDGTLSVSAPRTLMEGASFQAISFANVVGTFARYVMPNLDSGLFLDAVLEDGGFTFVVRRQG